MSTRTDDLNRIIWWLEQKVCNLKEEIKKLKQNNSSDLENLEKEVNSLEDIIKKHKESHIKADKILLRHLIKLYGGIAFLAILVFVIWYNTPVVRALFKLVTWIL